MRATLLILVAVFGNVFAQAPDTMWTRTFGGTGTEAGTRTIVSSEDRIFVLGNTSSIGPSETNFLLMEVGTSGDSIRSHAFGGTSIEECFGGCMGNDGNILLVGFTLSFGHGLRDIWVVKSSPTGTQLWARAYGTWQDEYGFDIVRAPGGGYYVIVRTETATRAQNFMIMKITETGDSLWSRNYGAAFDDENRNLFFTSDGGVVMVGHSESFGSTLDIWALRLNSNLDSAWSRVLNPGSSDYGYAIAELTNGNIVVGGSSDSRPYVCVLNSVGVPILTRRYGTTSGAIRTIMPLTDSGFICGGAFNFTGATQSADLGMMRFESNGDSVWLAKAPISSSQSGGSTARLSDGSFVLSGQRGSDVFVVRFETIETPVDNGPIIIPAVYDYEDVANSCTEENSIEGFDCESNYWSFENDVTYQFSIESTANMTLTASTPDSNAMIMLFTNLASPLGSCFAADVALFPGSDATISTMLPAGTYYVATTAQFNDFCGPISLSITSDVRLPVELTSFETTPEFESVKINWATGSESELDHFELRRDGQLVSNLIASNSSTGSGYEFVDNGLITGIAYYYELSVVSVNGEREVLATESATPRSGNSLVTEYALYQNYPNPFNPETSIRFDLIENSLVNLTVYNVAGQEVASLLNGNLNAGSHTVNFDGANLTSGVYLYRLTAGEFTSTKKMVLMK